MVETTNSAGTVVAAVLETMGYATQEQILKAFDPLWQSGGVFLWTLACAGAVLAIAVYGSTRMASYLLIGPTLFYYLIYARTPVKPVLFQLGGGTPRTVDKAYQGPLEESKPPESMEVSAFFALYTNLINRFTKSMVDFILLEEDKEDMYFVTRTQMLERILNAQPGREKIHEIFDNLYSQSCMKMMDVRTALSDEQFSQEAENRLTALQAGGNSQAGGALTQLKLRRDALRNALQGTTTTSGQRVAGFNDFPINPNKALRDFVSTKMLEGGSTGYDTMLRKSATSWGGGSARAYAEAGLPNLTITCGDVWRVTTDAALSEADWFLKKLFKDNLRDNDDAAKIAANEKLLCNTIAAKLHRRSYVEGGNCDLTQAAALFLLRNEIFTKPASELSRRVMDRTHLVSSVKGTVCGNRIAQAPKDRWLNTSSVTAPTMRTAPYSVTGTQRKAMEVWDPVKQEWCRAIDVEAPGMFDTAFIIQQTYQSAGFQQKIFTYALQMPYWQGVLLYYLAILYPFVAMLVVIPAKARGFLIMPAMWLWVKSWDIGFAMVMVLDKLMWNILPSSDLPYNSIEFRQGVSLADSLPSTLGAALSIDPTFNIHLHYNFTAMALFAVPAITGAAILKGKQSLLARFTQEPEQAAAEAESRAEDSHGMVMMHGLDYQFQNFTGKGLLSLGSFGQGVWDSGNGNRAADVATKGGLLAGGIGAIASLDMGAGVWGNARNVTTELSNAASDGVRGAGQILTAQASVAGAKLQGWDETFGYAGNLSRRYQSTMSSMDGSNGKFEIYNINTKEIGGSVWRKEVDQLLTEMNYGVQVGGSIADSVARRASGVFGNRVQSGIGMVAKGATLASSMERFQAAIAGEKDTEMMDMIQQAGVPPPDNPNMMPRDQLYRPTTGPARFLPDTSKFNLTPTSHEKRMEKVLVPAEAALKWLGNELDNIYKKVEPLIPSEIKNAPGKAADALLKTVEDTIGPPKAPKKE